jgi:hypothetical protein
LRYAIEGWINTHNLDHFLRTEEDQVIENYYYAWLEENCPHTVYSLCDCKVPELSHDDVEKRIREVYKEFCLDFGIDDIMEEMQDALNDLDDVDSPEDELASFVFALHLNHVHGSIVHHCQLIDYKMLDSIMQNGLADTFGQDVIDEFIYNW